MTDESKIVCWNCGEEVQKREGRYYCIGNKAEHKKSCGWIYTVEKPPAPKPPNEAWQTTKIIGGILFVVLICIAIFTSLPLH